jgi:hypothetical protein
LEFPSRRIWLLKGPEFRAQGKKGLSEDDETLVKARKMKAEDPGAALKP